MTTSRHPPASLPLPLLLLTLGCAGASLSHAAIVTITTSGSRTQDGSLDRRGRSSSSSPSLRSKSSLALVSSTTTHTTTKSSFGFTIPPSATPTSTGLMISTTSRNAAPTTGPYVSSPTTDPSAIIGVGVAGFVLLAVVGGWWWWWWRRRHRHGENRDTIVSLASQGVTESAFRDSAMSMRKSFTFMFRRDTLVSESTASDVTLHAPSDSPLEVRTSKPLGTVHFETPPIRETVETGCNEPLTREPAHSHDALEPLATRQRMHPSPLPIPIQSPILLDGPPSPLFTPLRTSTRARGPEGEYDAASPITPLSPRPVRRRFVTIDDDARVGGEGSLGRTVGPLHVQTRAGGDTSSSLPSHCQLQPP